MKFSQDIKSYSVEDKLKCIKNILNFYELPRRIDTIFKIHLIHSTHRPKLIDELINLDRVIDIIEDYGMYEYKDDDFDNKIQSFLRSNEEVKEIDTMTFVYKKDINQVLIMDPSHDLRISIYKGGTKFTYNNLIVIDSFYYFKKPAELNGSYLYAYNANTHDEIWVIDKAIYRINTTTMSKVFITNVMDEKISYRFRDKKYFDLILIDKDDNLNYVFENIL